MLKPSAVVAVVVTNEEINTALREGDVIFGTFPITFTVHYAAGRIATHDEPPDEDSMEIVSAVDAFGNDYTEQYDLGYFADNNPKLFQFLFDKFWEAVSDKVAGDYGDYADYLRDSQQDR